MGFVPEGVREAEGRSCGGSASKGAGERVVTVFPQLIFGYHGCEREVAEKVVLRKDLLHPSENRWDWLGTGAYFWEGAPERAMDWAKRNCKDPAVLGAVIGLGNCMNLMDVDSQALLQQTYQSFRAQKVELPINSKFCHDLDCSVVNATCEYLAGRGRAYDTVRGAFPEGDPVFADSKILTMTHVQICVRNPEVVVAYFLPR